MLQIVVALRSACLIESDPGLVVTYLSFLAQHSSTELTEMTDLVADMATLIVERSTIINAIIPSQDETNLGLDAFLSIFYSYLNKVLNYFLNFYFLLQYGFSAISISKGFVVINWKQLGDLKICQKYK